MTIEESGFVRKPLNKYDQCCLNCGIHAKLNIGICINPDLFRTLLRSFEGNMERLFMKDNLYVVKIQIQNFLSWCDLNLLPFFNFFVNCNTYIIDFRTLIHRIDTLTPTYSFEDKNATLCAVENRLLNFHLVKLYTQKLLPLVKWYIIFRNDFS